MGSAYTKILEKNICGHHGSSSVYFWHCFKLYLSHFGEVLGFWKVFYTQPPLFVDQFLPDNEKLEAVHQNFEKKLSGDIMGNQEYILGIILS